MEQFLRYVIGQLVGDPDQAIITSTEKGNRTIFYLRLPKPSLGKVIGKGGHTIQALRNLINASAKKHGQRATLEIIE